MNLLKLSIALLMSAVTALPAAAEGSITFSYDTGDVQQTYWGTDKKENYDVAIRILDANFVGKKITKVSVPIQGGDDISNCRVWLSKNLTLETINNVKENVPDIMSAEVTPENGMLSLTLSEPYTITEEGVYVGYSFDVDELTTESCAPLFVAMGDDANGFYLHTSRTYRSWASMTSSLGAVSSIAVEVTGDFYENSVGISAISETNVKCGEPSTASVTLINNGSTAIESVDYTYDVAGLSGTNHFTLPEPIPAQYNKTAVVELPLPAVAEKGAYPLTITLTKVNDTENINPQTTATTTLNAFSFIPVHRPLLEEYTGMWCGYCPRGFVGLELMNKYYPDLFVGVSYHNGDVLTTIPSSMYPSSVPGFPDAWLDRIKETDAYHGDDMTYTFGIDKVYLARAAEMAPADIDIKADWSDGSQEVINVYATVKFAKAVNDEDYRLAYILLADSLHGETDDWAQSNYYSGDYYYADCEGMEPFINGGSYVSGLYYNDVFVMSSELKGIAGSLPATIGVDESISHSYQFDINGAVNTSGQPVIQDKANLRVVVLLLDAKTGEVLNTNKVKVGADTATGITKAEAAEGDIKSVSYYDASGRKVAIPTKGMYIRSVTYKNGNVKTMKYLKK